MVLDNIAKYTRKRVAILKEKYPLSIIKHDAEVQTPAVPFAFEKALRSSRIAFICEIKKASPSQGIIDADFAYLDIAKQYEYGGAAAISVLTEPKFFLGNDRFLTEIKATVNIPILRKDFIIDDYQIYESKCLGADAILLIAALLDTPTLQRYIKIADSLGMSALIETHDAAEINRALTAGARIIGVNNRNLKDFSVNIANSLQLRPLVPSHCLFIAESGIKTAKDVNKLQAAAADAALIGETLMRQPDKIAAIAELYGETPATKLKVCGLSTLNDIAAVNAAKPDYVGFVFADSKRQVTALQAKSLKTALDPAIKTVGVFVNENPQTIAKLCQNKIIDLIQLHGNESNAEVDIIRSLTNTPIIQACRVRSQADIVAYQHSTADYLLFDTFSDIAYGGTGTTFDWNLLSDIRRPFFLAGGLSLNNAAAAIYHCQPYCLDISSGVETNGLKDAKKIKEITSLIRRLSE